MSGNFDENSRRNPMNVGAISYSSQRARQEAFELLREIAGGPDKPVKGALDRARARLKPHLLLGLNRIEEIWYGRVRLIRAEEIDALRTAAAVRRQKMEAGRVAAAELADLYLGMAERLRQIDEDIHRFEIDRLERQARSLCPMDRPGASPGGVTPLASDGGGDV